MSYLLNQKRKYKFQSEWKQHFEWVVPVKYNQCKAYCALCNLTLDISRIGRFSLLQHEKSKKHGINCSENNGKYRHGRNKYESTQSGKIPVEYPNNTARINSHEPRVQIERIDDHSIMKIVSPGNPQAPPTADKSANILVSSTGLSSTYHTNLPNRNLTVNEGSSSLQSLSKRLDNVRNTREFSDGSRLGLPGINEFSENNSKLIHSDRTKNSSPELLDSKTSRATGQSVSPAYNDDNFDVSVPPEPIQTGTTMEKPRSYPSIPTSHIAMEETLRDVEMKFEVESNCLSSSSTSTSGEETDLNSNMTLKGNDYPSTSGLSTERNAVLPFGKSNPSIGLNKTLLSELLDRYSKPSSREAESAQHIRNTESFNRRLSCGEGSAISSILSTHSNIDRRREMRSEKRGLSSRSCLQTPHTSQRMHSTTRDKSCLKNEIRSIFERLDEAKREYENKCRTIMGDYEILLNRLSQESDPTFPDSDIAGILMPEYASSWNSLKLLKVLFSEESSSENLFPKNKQETTDGQHDDGSNSDKNFRTYQTRWFSRGRGQTRRRGRRKREVADKDVLDKRSRVD